MPRFVVLNHDWPEPHFDIMLESEGALLTWRLQRPPVHDQPAERIGDHRRAYLDYEGPVSGGRGLVTAWDRGGCIFEVLEPDHIVACLRGVRLSARVELVSLPIAAGRQHRVEEVNPWRFRYVEQDQSDACASG
jgi:hypothetical protein